MARVVGGCVRAGWRNRDVVLKRKKPLGIAAAGVLLLLTGRTLVGTPVDTAGATVRCPSEVGRYFASPGGEATLVKAYRTRSFVVVVCQDSAGGLHYDGRKRDAPPGSDTHIALPAEAAPPGHVARNGSVEYRISDGGLVVRSSGAVVVDEVATPFSP
ncbi:hypothetical protein [Actinosynnema sp. NPDC020468]|uniref:hypothetical protein n=1 Tax=Actinosynnema sp. NPDC020468 TaxID=3154488 RepID=UPI0033EDF1D7